MTNLALLSYVDLEKLGYGSRVTVWRKVRDGKFPRPFDLGTGRIAWKESDIAAWLESRGVVALEEQFRQGAAS
jgi:prophage regulatory protein